MEQNQMNNDEIEIDLREIFSVLLSHLGIIILSGLVLGLVAIVGTKVFITPQYQSVTKMYGADKNEKIITGLKRISKPGLRIYAGKDELPRVLGGLGIAILSTNQGVITDKEARKLQVGGEVLAFVW